MKKKIVIGIFTALILLTVVSFLSYVILRSASILASGEDPAQIPE